MSNIAPQDMMKNALICDLAFGFEPEIEFHGNKWDVLDEYRTAGLSYISLHVAVDTTSLETTVKYIATVSQKITHSDKYLLVETVEDILKAKQLKKLGVCLVFQGANPIAKSLDMLDLYYKIGVRSMILYYNTRNFIGDGCAETRDAGLSLFGKKVIARMNQVGLLIDCSHTGYKTAMEIIEHSRQPVIFSHSNAYAVKNHARNIKDDLIQAIAASGGLVGISGVGVLLGGEDHIVQRIADHMEHIIQLVGVEHVALGSDRIYFPNTIANVLQANPVLYPQEYDVMKVSNPPKWTSFQPTQIPDLIEALFKRHLTESDIKKILGENYLRVARQVWRTAPTHHEASDLQTAGIGG